MSQPITEASNPLTEDIDIASPQDIVSILEQCDEEIFQGFHNYKSLYHQDTINTIEGVVERIRHTLEHPHDGIIVFSGCGTSGRLGFIVAKTFNEFMIKDGKPAVFHYALAGGDKAFFTSQESPEDDPRVGVETLKQLSKGKNHVVFIGITCGLSAPYVAGQLEYCMDHMDTFTPVLMGFNPVELARNTPIETWDKTFANVVERMKTLDNSRCYILNPVVGPEPITGSSRMKGGTVTKLLLETMCMKAFTGAYYPDRQWSVSDFLDTYKLVSQTVYRQKTDISRIIQFAGDSLRHDGNIYYLGNDSLALMGIIDASECPPTYGATLDDVRGFVKNGYRTLNNREGDLSELGRHYRISLDDFEQDMILTERDTVIMLNNDECVQLPNKVLSSKCKKVLITFQKMQRSGFDVILNTLLPSNEICALIGAESMAMSNPMFREIASKWCLNAVTTGAHILKGKVYRNIMIDVKVSNNKLFHRALGILKKLANLTEQTSVDYLLRSIYDSDDVTADMRNALIANHVVKATPKDRVVPVALVSAVLKCPVAEAKEMLSKDEIVRHYIVQTLQNVS